MAAHSLQDKDVPQHLYPASSTFQPLPSLTVTFPRAGLREASKSTAFTPTYAFPFTSLSAQNAFDSSPKFSIPS